MLVLHASYVLWTPILTQLDITYLFFLLAHLGRSVVVVVVTTLLFTTTTTHLLFFTVVLLLWLGGGW